MGKILLVTRSEGLSIQRLFCPSACPNFIKDSSDFDDLVRMDGLVCMEYGYDICCVYYTLHFFDISKIHIDRSIDR